MEGRKGMTMLREQGTDLAIALFALGAVLGSSVWIVGAGLVAGASIGARILRGEFMSTGRHLRPAGIRTRTS